MKFQPRLCQTTQLDSIVVRFGGEIGIKSEWTRHFYEKKLFRNINNALTHYNLPCEETTLTRGRIYIKTKNCQESAYKLTRLPGISSVSPATQTSADMNQIVQVALDAARAMTKKRGTFAVRCHRVGTHSYSSMDVCREAGKRILTDLKELKLHVDLTHPEITVSIEVRDKEAYVFTETLQGVGGFPVGSQAKVIGLLSGGIDSPVACWLAIKRGCPLVPVYFENSPLTDEATTAKALETAKKLFEWSIGYPRNMYIVPHGKNLETFMEKAPRKLTCLLCKRMMYRVAEHIADIERAEGIVTGEAIGEQASQTLTNLRVLDEAGLKYPVHRPLLGFDKTETTELAKRIGTLKISTRKTKGCDAAPSKPSTQARLEVVKNAEKELDIEEMVSATVKAAKIIAV
jgi:thiamine biosynthesis protein ThiI